MMLHSASSLFFTPSLYHSIISAARLHPDGDHAARRAGGRVELRGDGAVGVDLDPLDLGGVDAVHGLRVHLLAVQVEDAPAVAKGDRVPQPDEEPARIGPVVVVPR